MPGIMQLRQNFRGGGADMGTVDSDTRDARDEGAIAERMAQTQKTIDRNKRIKDFQKNLPKTFTQKYGPKLLNTALMSLVPMPLKIAYAAYQSYPKIASTINQAYDKELPTYQAKDLTSLLTPTGTTKKEEDDERIFGDNDPTIPTGILTQQPQMLSNMPMIDVPREDIYPFFNAANFDIAPQYRQYGIGNLYG